MNKCYNDNCIDHDHPNGCQMFVDLKYCSIRITEDSATPKDTSYEQLGISVGKLVDEKQAAYGNSFGKAGEFLKLLYPDCIKPEQYHNALALVRIFDKQMRIATDKDAFGENPYKDIVGYGLLGMGKGD